MNKIILALAVAVLPALSVALAAEPTETAVIGAKAPAPSVVVRYAPSELKTAEGVRALHGRLTVAAWQVCNQVLPRPVSIDGAKCRTDLVESAEAEIARR